MDIRDTRTAETVFGHLESEIKTRGLVGRIEWFCPDLSTYDGVDHMAWSDKSKDLRCALAEYNGARVGGRAVRLILRYGIGDLVSQKGVIIWDSGQDFTLSGIRKLFNVIEQEAETDYAARMYQSSKSLLVR